MTNLLSLCTGPEKAHSTWDRLYQMKLSISRLLCDHRPVCQSSENPDGRKCGDEDNGDAKMILPLDVDEGVNTLCNFPTGSVD